MLAKLANTGSVANARLSLKWKKSQEHVHLVIGMIDDTEKS